MFTAAKCLAEGLSLEALVILKVEKWRIFLVNTWKLAISVVQKEIVDLFLMR
jgi:hypothetical protein